MIADHTSHENGEQSAEKFPDSSHRIQKQLGDNHFVVLSVGSLMCLPNEFGKYNVYVFTYIDINHHL